MPTPTPAAIRAFIDTTNAEDTGGFLASFATDATIDDCGRVFRGVEAIASWNDTDNIGQHSRFDVVEVARGTSPGEYVVTVDVTGEGYTGIGTMTFMVDGDRVRSLVIT